MRACVKGDKMLNLNEDEQRAIVDYYSKLIDNRMVENKELFEERLPEYWERHLGTYSSKKDPDFPFVGSANCHIPWSAFSDTALESRFVAGVHSSEKLISVEGLTSTSQGGARKAADTFNYKLAKNMCLYNVICDMFQGLVVEAQDL